MQDKAQTSSPLRPAEGARDLQAQLYREIGISAVAAALHSIGQPDPGAEKRPAEISAARRPGIGRSILAA